MSEFTVINPPVRSRSHSEDSDRDSNLHNDLISEGTQEPIAKKQKDADDTESDSDKENHPKTPEDSTDTSCETYQPSQTVRNWKISSVFGGSRIATGTDDNAERRYLYKPFESLLHDDSAVPEHLRLKKYDTKPPPGPSRDQVLAAAERLIPTKAKRDYELDYDDHSIESTPKRRKKDNSGQQQNTTPDAGPRQVIINGRSMIVTGKSASRMQKVVLGFPLPQDPFPVDFTLTELCTQYPNHLYGDNLHPFLQHEWSASKIAKLLPDQSQMKESDRVTANAIASRLRKTKATLERLEMYTSLMNGPKTHAEVWNNSVESESSESDTESEESEEIEESTEATEDLGDEANNQDFVEEDEEGIAQLV